MAAMLEGRPSPDSPEEAQHVERLLNLPYSFILIPDGEKGGYAGQVLEFPGCFSQGETAAEAHDNLREAARSWILAALDSRHSIPPPLTHLSHGNGWVRLQLPNTLHARAARIALTEGVTLEHFMLATIAEKVGGAGPDVPAPDPRSWAHRAELAFAMLEKAPEHYQWLVQPILLRALSDASLRPFIDVITTDAFFKHIFSGGRPAPFL